MMAGMFIVGAGLSGHIVVHMRVIVDLRLCCFLMLMQVILFGNCSNIRLCMMDLIRLILRMLLVVSLAMFMVMLLHIAPFRRQP